MDDITSTDEEGVDLGMSECQHDSRGERDVSSGPLTTDYRNVKPHPHPQNAPTRTLCTYNGIYFYGSKAR